MQSCFLIDWQFGLLQALGPIESLFTGCVQVQLDESSICEKKKIVVNKKVKHYFFLKNHITVHLLACTACILYIYI